MWVKIPVARFILGALLASSVPQAPAQPGPTNGTPTLSTAQWRADLDVFARDLPKKHLNAFFHTSEADFRAAVAAFNQEIPTLDPPAIVLGLARLAAMLRDGHTSVDISPFSAQFHLYPFVAVVLKDGVLIVASTPALAGIRGLELKSINGQPVARAIDRLATLYSWENEPTRLHRARDFLNVAEMLRVAGVITNERQASFEVLDPKTGEARSVVLDALPGVSLQMTNFNFTPQGVAKVSFQRRPQAMWWETAPETKALYVRYDRCKDDQDKTIQQYCEDLRARLDQGGCERIIIDLRQNGGGSSSLLDPFITHLASRKELRKRGAIITLIGRGTFSSAQLNAVRLRNQAHSVLIGSPTGQKPNAYGEVKRFELPNSQLKVWYSTKHFVTEKGDPPSTMPDVLAEATIGDYFNGRDPALEAALAYKP